MYHPAAIASGVTVDQADGFVRMGVAKMLCRIAGGTGRMGEALRLVSLQ